MFASPSMQFFVDPAYIVAPVTLSMGVSWSNHVTTNGGATPSAGNQTAVSVLWTRLVNDGISSLIYSMVGFVDSITACITPITSSTNNWKWTNNGFVSTDLTPTGLYASSSAKYIDTQVTCSSTYTSSNDVGVSYYLYNSDSTAIQNDWGILGTNRFAATVASGSTSFFDCWAVATGRVSGATNNGFQCMNRTSNTNLSYSFYNSAFPNGLACGTTTAASQGTMPGGGVYIFRQNTDGNNRNTNKLKFWATHRGMTAAQSLKFYNAVQQFCIDTGGGNR